MNDESDWQWKEVRFADVFINEPFRFEEHSSVKLVGSLMFVKLGSSMAKDFEVHKKQSSVFSDLQHANPVVYPPGYGERRFTGEEVVQVWRKTETEVRKDE